MSHELKEGVKLKSIIGIPDNEGTFVAQLGSRQSGVKSITVVEQPGQMGMVPWARVERENGTVQLVNLANVELVELATEESA